MSLFQEFSELPGGRAVLLSIKPKYADLILAGTKTVELRRSWPSNDIGVMILYSSAPVQKLVGVAYVEKTNKTDVNGLWELAEQNGGGVTYEELTEYFQGKKNAFGIMIKSVRVANNPIDPKEIFPDFTAPQSYLYLDPKDFQKVMTTIFTSDSK